MFLCNNLKCIHYCQFTKNAWQDSHTASILQNLRSSGEKEAKKYEVQIDPNLMPILEEIERGGPAMMMKYGHEDPYIRMCIDL